MFLDDPYQVTILPFEVLAVCLLELSQNFHIIFNIERLEIGAAVIDHGGGNR